MLLEIAGAEPRDPRAQRRAAIEDQELPKQVHQAIRRRGASQPPPIRRGGSQRAGGLETKSLRVLHAPNLVECDHVGHEGQLAPLRLVRQPWQPFVVDHPDVHVTALERHLFLRPVQPRCDKPFERGPGVDLLSPHHLDNTQRGHDQHVPGFPGVQQSLERMERSSRLAIARRKPQRRGIPAGKMRRRALLVVMGVSRPIQHHLPPWSYEHNKLPISSQYSEKSLSAASTASAASGLHHWWS